MEKGALNPLVEKIVLEILKRLIDDQAIYAAKVAIVEMLSELAKKSGTKLDDFAVGVIAEALGVPYEVKQVLPHNNA